MGGDGGVDGGAGCGVVVVEWIDVGAGDPLVMSVGYVVGDVDGDFFSGGGCSADSGEGVVEGGGWGCGVGGGGQEGCRYGDVDADSGDGSVGVGGELAEDSTDFGIVFAGGADEDVVGPFEHGVDDGVRWVWGGLGGVVGDEFGEGVACGQTDEEGEPAGVMMCGAVRGCAG
ncbi:Uncharacterised protein [Dermatophilus congolensis]|uniref:Uncharacterized protein n=1 Tax=Dermatophilus congolensis TaxID=1863 RepID=A0AA46BLB1_9MICO|nr:Uncharacterised protein [Dermatophilus congolensis]